MTAPADADADTQPEAGSGRLAENIMHFGRVLRAAGLPVGPGAVIAAVRAVEAVGLRNRDDFYWALHAVFVNRRDQRELFDQAFQIFWRNPEILERMMSMMLPSIDVDTDAEEDKSKPEVVAAPGRGAGRRQASPTTPAAARGVRARRAMTWSDARNACGRWTSRRCPTRKSPRRQGHHRGCACRSMNCAPAASARTSRRPRADLRATLRAACAAAATSSRCKFRSSAPRHPPLVVLCDISGSMSRYSRMLLHFLHAVTNDRDRVHTFLFGTRLTNVTRYLRYKDIDVALEKIAEAVHDWSGGTRIGRLPARIQPRLVAPRARPGGPGAADHRRAGPRRRATGLARRDGAPAPVLPAADLAQPALALRGLRAQIAAASGRSCPMSTISGRCTTLKA